MRYKDELEGFRQELIAELSIGASDADCPLCSVCENQIQTQTNPTGENISIEERAKEYLVTNFHDYKKQSSIHIDRFPYRAPTTPEYSCESNPELDPYIIKPQFSRDHADYNTDRGSEYEQRKLVCDELSEHQPGVQSKQWIDDCDDALPLSQVISVIAKNVTELALTNLKELNLKIIDENDNVTTPYVLLFENHFDFDAEDANLVRMVREAEAQSADIVAGSWRNENGHWSTSCLHHSLQNYTLDIWEGYYKSINSVKYCDFSFGPMLIRKGPFIETVRSVKQFIGP